MNVVDIALLQLLIDHSFPKCVRVLGFTARDQRVQQQHELSRRIDIQNLFVIQHVKCSQPFPRPDLV